MEQKPDRQHWSRVAEQWTPWARKPGHDAFWAYRDDFDALSGQAAEMPWTLAVAKAESLGS
ncbi:hypothetical protein ACFSM5_03810 [Lacibacterium aquatile]|uniref:Uncharacterized protein n=1 Tax=Lacibacterium aquatile TaxID=1168082 RepID=A0ABW5DRU1_9PROT